MTDGDGREYEAVGCMSDFMAGCAGIIAGVLVIVGLLIFIAGAVQVWMWLT